MVGSIHFVVHFQCSLQLVELLHTSAVGMGNRQGIHVVPPVVSST